jgi:hypothetical protein
MREVVLRIERFYETRQTRGVMSVMVDGLPVYSCSSLELPWLNNQRRISCIQEGTYKAKKHRSPKFGDAIWILDVPGRSEILIHPANYVGSPNPKTKVSDLLGCVATGDVMKDITNDDIVEILNSKAVMKTLLSMLPDEFTIQIVKG